VQCEPEADQALSPAADRQAAGVPELRGQCSELALIPAKHGSRVQAHQALTKLGESFASSSEIRSLHLMELLL
jgi:hypothetical protein